MNKERRLPRPAPHQIGVSGLQRLVRQQMIAEADQHLRILARVGIGNGRDIGGGDGQARIGEQRRMQRALDDAGVRRRYKLRPRARYTLRNSSVTLSPPPSSQSSKMMAAGNSEVERLYGFVGLRCRCAISARSTTSPGAASLVLAFDVEKGKRPRRLCVIVRPQRAEGYVHGAVVIGAMHGDQHVLRLMRQQFDERDLVFGCAARRLHVGRAEIVDQPLRQHGHQRFPVGLAGLDDLHQRRPAERGRAEKTAAKRRARLAFESARIAPPKTEGARHRPFAGRGWRRLLEYECIGGVELDGARRFHSRGPRLAQISHAGLASSGSSFFRSTAALPMRRSVRSPFSSISRRTSFSAGRCSR